MKNTKKRRARSSIPSLQASLKAFQKRSEFLHNEIREAFAQLEMQFLAIEGRVILIEEFLNIKKGKTQNG